MSDQQPPVGPRDGSSQGPRRGSESLRSLGTAWFVVGVLGLLALLIAYLATGWGEVWVAVPLLLVFLMLGGLWHVQGRRRTPPS